jgi:hypothetical protein
LKESRKFLPIRTARQMFGSALHMELRIAGALAIDPQGYIFNEVRESALAIAVSDMAQFELCRPEASRLNAI